MTADCARLCLWCLLAPPHATPRHASTLPPPASVLFCSFSHLSQQTPLLFITASALREPLVNPWHHTGPISKGMKIQTALCHQFPLPSHRPVPPSLPDHPPHHYPPPFISLDKQCKAPRRLPPWISLSSPSGNVCWSFRVSCQTGWVGGGGQRLSSRSRREERETASAGGDGARRRSAEDALRGRSAAPIF